MLPIRPHVTTLPEERNHDPCAKHCVAAIFIYHTIVCAPAQAFSPVKSAAHMTTIMPPFSSLPVSQSFWNAAVQRRPQVEKMTRMPSSPSS